MRSKFLAVLTAAVYLILATLSMKQVADAHRQAAHPGPA
jgi:hypothetical protein